VLLLASLLLVVHGFWLLRWIGKQRGKIDNLIAMARAGGAENLRKLGDNYAAYMKKQDAHPFLALEETASFHLICFV
jgi:hypothetical protein